MAGAAIIRIGDRNARTDGWFNASGTSAATAQIAGVVALMVERARRSADPTHNSPVKAVLQQTATPVLYAA